MKSEHIDQSKMIKGIGKVDYISKKKFKELHPMNGVGYSVIGFIGDGVYQPIGEWRYHNEMRVYYSIKKKLYIFEVIGYVEIEENVYIAILQRKLLKKLIPFFMLFILIGLFMFYIMAPNGPELEDGMDKYTPKSGISENTDPSRIVLPGYSEVNMEANTDKAYVALWNPDGNPCYFRFKITLKETGDVIYQSKMIPPGYAVTTVQFDRKFPSGKYPVSIKVDAYSLDDYTVEMNSGDIETILVSIEK